MRFTMKNIKFLSLLLAVVGVLSFASCQHEHADFTPGPQDATMGVFFPSTSRVNLTEDGTEATILVKRNNASEAATISVLAADINKCGLFTIQGSEFEDGAARVNVTFEAGKDEASIVFGYNAADLEVGKRYEFALQLDQENASQYGISDAVFTLAIPEPWVAWDDKGTKGIYFDDCLCYVFAEPDSFVGLGTYVDIEKHATNPNRIRVVNPFSKMNIAAMWGGIPAWMTIEEGDEPHAIEFDITDPNNVIPSSNPITLNLIVSGARLGFYLHTNEDGSFMEPIKLENGIIKFPVGKVALAALDPSDSTKLLGWYSEMANLSGHMQFYLPGTEFVSYGISAAYDGMYISPDGSVAKAVFNFALGTDVASYKFAIVPGDVVADPAAVVDGIVAGSKDLTIFESDAETRRWEVELTPGNYTLVAVPYTAEGEARVQDAYATAFYFNGAGEMPEVAVDVKVGVPSELVAPEEAAEMEAECPSCFNIGVKITADGSLISSMKIFYGDMAAVEKEGISLDELFSKYAADATSVWLPKLREKGSMVGTVNVNAGTVNSVLMRFETIYGTTIDYQSEPYTLPAYDGEFYVGDYTFMDATTQAQMLFGVIPGKSYADYYFTHSYIDGSKWYAVYDKEKATFTVTGVELGYENYENQYGTIYGALNEEVTQVYSYMSSVDNTFEDSTAPIVFEVKDNMLSKLTTYFAMGVYGYDLATDTLGEFLGNYFLFTPETQIAPAAGLMSKSVVVASSKVAETVVCSQADLAGVAVEYAPVIKATPVYTFDFAQATLK